MLNKLHSNKPVTVVVVYYVAAILIATLLLKLPIFINQGESVSLLDAFFTSNSAIATTGLVTFDYTTVYNYGGWAVLVILFNIGGMGIIVLNTLLILLLGKKIGFKQRMLAKLDYNQTTHQNIVYVLKHVVKYFLVVEVVCTILIFLKIGYVHDNVLDRFMNALFMTSSAISGSGFYDTTPYSNDYFVQYVLIIGMIFSFIGYPVVADLHEWIKAKLKKKKYRFTRFTKIVVTVNLVTMLAFMFIFFLLERESSMIDMTIFEQLQHAFYISISTKSVGLNLFTDINDWTQTTLVFSTIFMLIGGSPSSACGGIRVGAIYIIYKHIEATIKGKCSYMSYGFIIPDRTIMKAYIVSFFYVAVSFIATIVIFMIEVDISMFSIWYDVVSGFTTTGFSTGALSEFGPYSVFIVAVLMGVGRIGIMNLLSLSAPRENQVNRIEFIQKDITI